MNIIKKCIVVITIVGILLFGLPLIASADGSGSCGNNVRWSLSNGVLTISGTGAMDDCVNSNVNTGPWSDSVNSITSIVINNGVTYIGAHAFYNCKNLTSVTMANSVTSIGDYAFYYCTKLTNVQFSTGLTSIGDTAFGDCKLSGTVTLNSVQHIGSHAFNYCKGMTGIVLPDSLTDIGEYAFSSSGLTSFTIPSNMTTIPTGMLSGCSSLQSITIPDNISGIGEAAFNMCTKIKSITIPSGVTSIERSTFYYCTSLQTITIPASVSEIKTYALADCTSLNTIYYEGSNAQWNAINKDSTNNNVITNATIHYNYHAHVLIEHPQIDPTFTASGTEAYWECSICGKLFADAGGSSEITSPVVIPMKVSIASGSCGTNLNWALDEAGALWVFGTGAMDDCINSNVNTAPWSDYTNSITSLIINDGVTYIGAHAFYKCQNLTSVTMANSVTSIGDYAFYYCTKLTNVQFSTGLTSIGDTAFGDCKLSGTVTLNSVQHIGPHAFNYCKGMTGIVLPDSLTDIGEYAFSGSGLTSFTFPSNMTTIPTGMLANCSSLKNITIPDTITSIGEAVFSMCTKIEEITIPAGVTSIENSTFYYCTSLETIIIPSSVISIKRYAIADCSGLNAICFEGSSKQWNVINIDSTNNSIANATIQYLYNHTHSLIAHEQVNSTCIDAGTGAYWECNTCDMLFSDAGATTEIEAAVIIPATGHTMTATAAKAATCTEAGNSAYWKCTVCNKYFSDADGETEIEENSWIIPVAGHSWNAPTYVWADDNLTVTATRTCKNGDHPETESVAASRELVTAPTDKEAGAYQIVTKAFENPAFEIQTKDNLPIPALETLNVLNLPAFLKTIETEAFEGIAAEAIIVPDSCTTIEPKAFINCKNLLYIRIPAGIEIPEDAFTGCPNVVIDQK